MRNTLRALAYAMALAFRNSLIAAPSYPRSVPSTSSVCCPGVGTVPTLAALGAGREIVRGRNLYHGQSRVEQTDIDNLSFPRALAMPERGQRADRRVQRGVAVDHRGRGADRMPLDLAGQRHEAAHRLAQRVERRTIAIGAVLAEAGDRDEDDPVVERAQPLVVEAHRGHHAGPEVLEHHVGLRHQRGEDLLALGMAQVETDALLAAVVDREVHALAAHHRRMAARLLTAGRLDLDDLGAEIGQQHPAAWPGLES